MNVMIYRAVVQVAKHEDLLNLLGLLRLLWELRRFSWDAATTFGSSVQKMLFWFDVETLIHQDSCLHRRADQRFWYYKLRTTSAWEFQEIWASILISPAPLGSLGREGDLGKTNHSTVSFWQALSFHALRQPTKHDEECKLSVFKFFSFVILQMMFEIREWMQSKTST